MDRDRGALRIYLASRNAYLSRDYNNKCMSDDKDRDFTTIALKDPTYPALERVMATYDLETRNDAVSWLIWYHDLINKFGYSPDDAQVRASEMLEEPRVTNLAEY